MKQSVFKQYYTKLSGEAWIKALLCGSIFGFSALLLSALVFWVVKPNLWWVSLVILLTVTGGVTPLLYFKKFQPSKKGLARRIDDLGLEERVLTMHELEHDTSVMAELQRRDTLKTLEKFNASLLKFIIPVSMVVALSVLCFAGTGMTTVAALSAYGIIKDGSDVIGSTIVPEKTRYEVVYEIDGSGQFEGKAVQLVCEGETAETVKVIPDDGWRFVEWSDGYKNPVRSNVDVDVRSNLTFVAVLAEIEEGEDDDDNDGDEADAAGDLPTEPGEGQGEGDGESNEPGDEPGDGAGGKYEPSNQVFDGETFYGGEVYDAAYDDMKEEVSKDQQYSEEEKDTIGDYFDIIKK